MTQIQEKPMQARITFEGEHVDMATPDEIAAGIGAASAITRTAITDFRFITDCSGVLYP